MKLKDLQNHIPSIEIIGTGETEILGVTADSRSVRKGDLFIAKSGQHFDAANFISQAIELGACAIATTHFLPKYTFIPQVIHENIKEIEASIAAFFYCNPSQQLSMVGVTGTNGKTTISYLIKHLLDSLNTPCGLIGTIENIIAEQSYPAHRTTPDVVANHRLLNDMVEKKCLAAVMEVTSHGLHQKRTELIDFDVAVYSNLTQDHLDYHKTMEQYCESKNLLFKHLGRYPSPKKKIKWAVVNQDCPWAARVIEGCQGNIFTYGIDQAADLQASHITLTPYGTDLILNYKEQSQQCFFPLIGRFNISNLLAAVGTCLVLGFEFNDILYKITKLPSVKGRIQPVKNELGLNIYVDYAHTEDALTKVIETLREINPKGRILVLFGCGGDRDQMKRPKMAQAVEALADYCLVTSDNPRNEEPMAICQEVVSGFSPSMSYEIEEDRHLAIQKILNKANPEDSVLIAGKGHENTQVFADRTISFDDFTIASAICRELEKYRGIQTI